GFVGESQYHLVTSLTLEKLQERWRCSWPQRLWRRSGTLADIGKAKRIRQRIRAELLRLRRHRRHSAPHLVHRGVSHKFRLLPAVFNVLAQRPIGQNIFRFLRCWRFLRARLDVPILREQVAPHLLQRHSVFFRPILRLRAKPDLGRRQNLVWFSVHWIWPDCFILSMRSLFAAYSSGEIPEDRAISISAVVSGARRPAGLPVVIETVSRVGGADTGGPAYCRAGAAGRGAGAGGLLSIGGLCWAWPLTLGCGCCSRNPNNCSILS